MKAPLALEGRALAAALLMAGCAGPRPRRRPPPLPPPKLAKAIARTARSYLPEEESHHAPPVDCSDFVRRVFAANGVRLPRTSREMARLGEPVLSARDLRMGDLVFFSGPRVSRAVGHVGIYINNGIFIHRPDAGEVRMESLYSDYFRKRYLAARRVIE